MKNLFRTLMVLTAFATTIAISSCTKEKDKCEGVVCQNGGTCADGTCTCPAGFEGTLCADESRTKFLGTYSASDSPGSLVYSVTIGSGGTITAVIISSAFSDSYFVNTVAATISGNTITIARQEPDSDNYFVEGTGTLTGNTISWNYKIIDGTVNPESIINYTATWTKP